MVRTVSAVSPWLLLLWAATPNAYADGNLSSGEYSLHIGGYAELTAAYHHFGENSNQPGGAKQDSRLELDTTRFVAEVEAMGPHGIELEVEFEFEHGGVGAAREIEYDEFGEFETDVEKGGEIVLEEFALKKTWGRYQLTAGRFYVPVGMLSYYYKPTDYLGSVRSEAEITVLPAQWDEMGVMFSAAFSYVKATVAVVNGLDSSGFGSQNWVSSGHQGAYELIRARDLAASARVDVSVTPEFEIGVSGYVGGTNNRPKPDLVDATCSDPNPDSVSPCGFIHAPLVIGDFHARYVGNRIHAMAWGMLGHLSKAAQISSRNARLSNGSGSPRTPVGDKALAIAAEVGYDLAPSLGICATNKLEPFARLDYYDTMFAPRDDLFDNPRFEKLVVGAGVAYSVGKGFVAKLDVSQRRFGSSDLRPETSVRTTLGVWF